ncbi:MAG: hypothetical protein AAGJ50_10095, partial [Pseudomonadota bacterium]
MTQQPTLLPEQTPESITWTATRDAGLARLSRFIPRAGRAYASQRSTDFGPTDRSNVSALSPWVRYRLVLETDILQATLARHSPSS